MAVNWCEFIRLLELASASSPAVRAQLDEAGVRPEMIRTEADLACLPVLRKDHLVKMQQNQPPWGGMLAVPQGQLQRIFMSPGPIFDAQGFGQDYWRWGVALAVAGFCAGDVVQNTFSYHLTPAGFMFDAAARAIGCVVIPAGVGNNELQVQMMRSVGVTGFVGVPSYLMTLIRKAEEMGFDFRRDFVLTKAFITAEKLPESLRRTLLAEYGVVVYQGYGTADLGCVAYECQKQQGMHMADGVVVELVDPDSGVQVGPGETGEVVVTWLNETYPLLRFGTGDLAVFTDEPCECGRTGRRLTGIIGRVGDAVKVRGMFLHPKQMEEVMGRFPEVGRCQAVVSRPEHTDQLTILLEPASADQLPSLDRIGETIKEVLRLKAELKLVPPGTIADGDKLIRDERVWD